MKKAKVVDHRRINLEKVASKDFIPFLGGRPKREKVIRHDDVVNLSIALNTAHSIEELLNIV